MVRLRHLLLFLALWPAWADAQQSSCASPRAAMATFLDNLQPDRSFPDAAITCFDWSAGPAGSAARVGRARNLKAVLDGRGLFVDYAAVPSDPDHLDADTGLARHVLFVDLPELVLERGDSGWRISASTVRAVPELMRRTYRLPLQRIASSLPPAWHREVLGASLWRWLALAVLLGLALLAGRIGERVIVGGFRRLAGRWLDAWDAELEHVLLRWAGVLFAAGLFAAATPSVGLPVRVNRLLLLLTQAGASIAAVFIANAAVELAADTLARRAQGTSTRMDDQLIPLLRRSMKVIVFVVGGLFVLQNLHVDVSSVVGSLAIGGLAVSLAAKDTLANLFGSLTIFTDQPFQIGDWVVVGGVEGVVEEVGFRSTRIRTFYDSLVAVPNSKVADAVVDNYGQRRYRRFKTTLALTYGTPPERVEAFVDGLRASIEAEPRTRKDAYEIHLHGLGESSLDVLVYVFFDVPSWTEELRGRQALLLSWMRLAQELGVDFAFPTRTVQVLGPEPALA